MTGFMLWKQGFSSDWGLCSQSKWEGYDTRYKHPIKEQSDPQSTDRSPDCPDTPHRMNTAHNRCSVTRLTIPDSPGMFLLQINLLLEHLVLAQEIIFILSLKITESDKSSPFISFCFLLWNIHSHTCTHVHMPCTLTHTHKCVHTNILIHSHACMCAHTCTDTFAACTHTCSLSHT